MTKCDVYEPMSMTMIRNVCLVDTPFALSLYLLMMPMDEIYKTKFITDGNLASSITNQLPNKCLNYDGYSIRKDWKRLLRVRLNRFTKYIPIIWSKVFAQDHLSISAQIIGSKKYTLITDGPKAFANWVVCPYQPFVPQKASTIKGRVKQFFAFGNTIYGLKFGTNLQCVQRWIVSAEDIQTHFIEGREFRLIDVDDLWKQSSNEKQMYIKRIFSISEDMLGRACKARTMILTQPFREDCGLTDEEYMSIYRPYIEKYEDVIVKPHPRDKFDFARYFPNVVVLNTPAPMQLLNYMGVNPSIAITVSSSSISAMSKEVEKVVLGTKINDKIFKIYGDIGND